MTCVAWDGETLAADKRATVGSLYRTTTKIYRVGSALVGYAGPGALSREMLAWARGGYRKVNFPELQRDSDNNITLCVIRLPGIIHVYENTPHAIEYEDKQFAMGSGRDFALAAMRLGKTAEEAVLLAAEFDPGTGNNYFVEH